VSRTGRSHVAVVSSLAQHHEFVFIAVVTSLDPGARADAGWIKEIMRLVLYLLQ